MTEDCIFCRIAAGEASADIVLATDTVVAFHDTSPAAPMHLLIIPRQHIASPAVLDETTTPVIGEMFLTARILAEQFGLAETGYRLVMNHGRDGDQSVFHMHLHLLGGRRLRWPPG